MANGLREHSKAIDKILTSSEKLSRLLYYKPNNSLDDVLLSSPTRPDILTMPVKDKWAIINDRIVRAPKFEDMVNNPKCRLCFYPSLGRSNNGNFLYADQSYNFDIYVHFDYQQVDMRMEWIADTINELMFLDGTVASVGKVLFKGRNPINAPDNYIGYRLIYEFATRN